MSESTKIKFRNKIIKNCKASMDYIKDDIKRDHECIITMESSIKAKKDQLKEYEDFIIDLKALNKGE